MDTDFVREGGAYRFSLTSYRPIASPLLNHADKLIKSIDPQRELRPVEVPQLHSWTWTFTGTIPEKIANELRGTATALAVDSALLTGEMATTGPQLIVTDVDSTFITTEIIEMLAAHADTEAEVRAITTAAMRGELDFAESLRERVATLAGVPQTVFQEILAEVELTAGAQRLVDAVHARGGHFGLVSGGFTPLLAPIAEKSGVDVYIANGLEIVDGKLTGRTQGPIVDRQAKADAVQRWSAQYGITPAQTLCAGDGANDLAMMAIAGMSVAFNAHPVVVENASCAVSFPRLDAICALLGWDVPS
ncbi:MAG: phosphoserine phosphatase SerB [Trueperella sp.]|nr:phosphoserine phosphatase SerB [Trueperella sp.]